MQLIVYPNGKLCCLYSETIDLAQLGELQVRRGSHVEPDEHGRWTADLAPCRGPILGPFLKRSDALAAEERWLMQHVLSNAPSGCIYDAECMAIAVLA
jgi:hypothetical protein